MKKLLFTMLVFLCILSFSFPVLAVPDDTDGFVPAEETYGAVAYAEVTKLKGNQNELTIWVVRDEVTIAEVVLEIDNNSAGEFEVGEFRVYVSTYGNTKIDHCFITFAPFVCPGHELVLFFDEELGLYVWKCGVEGCDHEEPFTLPDGTYMAPDGVPGDRNYPYPADPRYVTHLSSNSLSAIRNSRLYYPVNADGTIPEELPLIVFLHGYELSFSAAKYEYIARHFAQNGYLFLLAQYQTTLLPGNAYMTNAAEAINSTITYINNTATVPNLARDADGAPLYGLMGYSLGAITTLNLAADYGTGKYYNANNNLKPIPKPLFAYALELSNGGSSHFLETGNPATNRGGYWSKIDPDTYVIMTSGDAYPIGDYAHIFPYWNALAGIPAQNKQFIGFNSDLKPGAMASARVDAMHTYVSGWTGSSNPNINALNAQHFAVLRSAAALANTAFYGTDYEYWYGYDFMGVWWDATPINVPFLSSADTLSNSDWPQR